MPHDASYPGGEPLPALALQPLCRSLRLPARKAKRNAPDARDRMAIYNRRRELPPLGGIERQTRKVSAGTGSSKPGMRNFPGGVDFDASYDPNLPGDGISGTLRNLRQ